MKIISAEFVKSAVWANQYPPADLLEIAFAGRSNVGKSSLINTLVGRKRLVKTSSTPGRTQLINFFCVNQALSLVDLPGYGYAKVPPAVKRQWRPMVQTYLSGRPNLKAVVLLMDIRRRPQVEEMDLMQWLAELGIGVIPVLTKTDKLSRTAGQRQQRLAAEILLCAPDDLIFFSAKTRCGKADLWHAIERFTLQEAS